MPRVIKPPPLESGDAVRVIAPASPVEEEPLRKGCAELERLGFECKWDPRVLARQGYFAGSAEERLAKLLMALDENSSQAVFCARGGYGSGYLLERLEPRRLKTPKALVGYSDVTLLQLFLWRKKKWVTFYGPMIASGLDKGADKDGGYDSETFRQALVQANHGWKIDLRGETLFFGTAEGVLTGGCLTMIQATLGTPWEIQTSGAVLLLEDCNMKPYQIDRALIHLRQAGKFKGVRAVILGDFPQCEAPAGSPPAREVFERIFGALKIPVVYGAPVGHTARPMLTIPLGVRAKLTSQGSGRLEILEPACQAPEFSLAKRGKMK